MYLTPGVLLFLLYKYSFPDSSVMNSHLNQEDLIASMQVVYVVGIQSIGYFAHAYALLNMNSSFRHNCTLEFKVSRDKKLGEESVFYQQLHTLSLWKSVGSWWSHCFSMKTSTVV